MASLARKVEVAGTAAGVAARPVAAALDAEVEVSSWWPEAGTVGQPFETIVLAAVCVCGDSGGAASVGNERGVVGASRVEGWGVEEPMPNPPGSLAM